MSLMAASTRDAAPIGGWDGELQQLAERGGSGMMHGGSLRPFFFLGAWRFFLDWPQPADLLVDFQQLSTQLPEAMVFGNFSLSLCQTGRREKRFGDRLA